MKHIYLIIAILLSSSFMVYAYVPVEEYKGYKVKFYIEMNATARQNCLNLIDRVPAEYLEGVNYIMFKGKYKNIMGRYFRNTKVIEMYGNCQLWVFTHELAHHCQYTQYKDHWLMGIRHTGHFDECEDEIWGEVG